MSAIIGTWNLKHVCRPLPASSPDLLGAQEVSTQETMDGLVAKLPGT
ncbi:hypothetical protein ACFVVX_15905 [Kitasatospora sp. NPDC058170]